MAAKKPIKITVEDTDENEEKTVKPRTASKAKPAPTKKKRVNKGAKTRSIKRKSSVVRLNIDKNGDLPKKASQGKTIKKSALDMEDDAVRKVIKSSLTEDSEKKQEGAVEEKIISKRSINLYKRIAAVFLVLTVVLVLVISYYSFIKLTIVLIPNQERISNNMIFDVYNPDADINDAAGSIEGVVKLITVEHKEKYQASGEDIIGEDAIGKATIVNNYNKSQPLVATTRLMSPDGKLFRIKNTVNVPAGGKVEVDIYADNPSPDTALEPTRFTIPGLWAGLQDKIFAETKEKIEYKQVIKRHVTELDIKNAITTQREKLINVAKADINEDYKEYSQLIYKIDENSIESISGSEVGDEVDEFTVTTMADVVVVAFDDKPAAKLARQKFISSLAKGKELISFDDSKIIYTLNNHDYEAGIATINATFEGKVSLSEGSSIVEVDKILGLSRSQLETYLNAKPEIAGFEIKFQPTFLPSFMYKVPKLVDRIEVNIKK